MVNIGRRAVLAAGLAGLAGCAQAETASDDPSYVNSSPTASGTGSPMESRTGSPSASSGSSAGTPSETSSSGSTSPSESPNQGRRLTIVTSGDLLWHNTLWMAAAADHSRTGKGKTYDFDPMFAMMKPIIDGADLAIAHNEVPFAKPGSKPTGYPSFAAPSDIAPWMSTMGWDMATTASNHSLDQGFDGLVRTHRLLTDNGIKVVGTYPSKAVKDEPFMVEKKGVKVSVVSGTYDLNGYVPPAGKEWCVDMWDVDRMIAEAKAAKKAGADIVMAHLHGGDEYQTQPNADQVTRATALANTPEVDLVFGEHVHVVQPITQIDGTWVAYGMGNMVAQHLTSVPRGYEGITIRWTLAEQDRPRDGKVGRFVVEKCEYIPTMITNLRESGSCRLYPVKQALAEGRGPKDRLQVALDRTRKAVLSLDPPSGLIEA